MSLITVIRGDGIGPEIVDATIRVLEVLDCDLEFDYHEAGLAGLKKHGNLLSDETLEAIRLSDATLKGPLTTPIGEGFTSINVALRRHFDLYGNLRLAIRNTIGDQDHATPDLGGQSSTTQFTDAIISRLR